MSPGGDAPSEDDVSLRREADGRFSVHGPLTFTTVTGLLEGSENLFGGARDITISLRRVTRADSGGLALLLEWLRWARREQRTLRYEDVPGKLHAIAGLSGVEEMLQAGV